MTARATLAALLLPCLLLAGQPSLAAKESDTGKEAIGKVRATVYFGSNTAPAGLGKNAKAVPEAEQKRLRGIQSMRFKHYRKLGHDTQSVLRSYENWLTPLKPSEEIMLSFESNGRSENGGLRLDLELWQHKRKVMKSDPVLYKGRPLLILGPRWRGGRLIIAVELLQITNPS